MAFEKKVWLGGDTVTAAHLNRIENGIAEALGSGGSGALPAITSADNGKVMVAKNGEWTNLELLEFAQTYSVLPETEVVISHQGSETLYPVDFNSIMNDNIDPSTMDYTATHNGIDYKLEIIFDTANMDFRMYYPADWQARNLEQPEINIVYSIDATDFKAKVLNLPAADSHRLAIRAGGGTTILEDFMPVAIKAGEGGLSIAEGRQTTASGKASHAEGRGTTASGDYSHAESYNTIAFGASSHAEGTNTKASGENSHAEGQNTTASGYESHAEGHGTTASGMQAHAEGYGTTASVAQSHAEGSYTTASGYASHAEGMNTVANHTSQHVFGEYNVADPSTKDSSSRGSYIEIVGNGTVSARSNARTLDWNGNEVLAGKLTVGAAPTADMDVATKKYVDDHASGGGTSVVVAGEGVGSTVQGLINNNSATGDYAHVEGGWYEEDDGDGNELIDSNRATGNSSHAEGSGTTASNHSSHAEGAGTTASGGNSHAEGYSTKAEGDCSHAEGSSTTASGHCSHAEGSGTTASSRGAHAEGLDTTASGQSSHAEGLGTTAKHSSQHVFGEYNVEDPSTVSAIERGTYVEIVGNGRRNARSNARTLDWNGNEVLAGSLTLGKGTADEVTITPVQLKQLIAMLSA